MKALILRSVLVQTLIAPHSYDRSISGNLLKQPSPWVLNQEVHIW